METAEIKQLRARLVKGVEAAKKDTSAQQEKLRTIAQQARDSESAYHRAKKELTDFDKVFGQRLGIGEPAEETTDASAATPRGTRKNRRTGAAAKQERKAARAKRHGAKKSAGRAGARRAAVGRRAVAEGLRPPIYAAIAEVMGTNVMNAAEVVPLLEAKNWQADTDDQKVYVGYMLSQHKESFERVPEHGRGYYRVRPDARAKLAEKVEQWRKIHAAKQGGVKTDPEAPAAQPVAESAPAPAKRGAKKGVKKGAKKGVKKGATRKGGGKSSNGVHSSVDEILSDVGIGSGSSVFAES